MKCLKCLKVDPPLITKPLKGLPPLLAHLEGWCLCAGCIDQSVVATAEKAAIYYRSHKGHYRKLHIKYKADLSSSYVKNIIASSTKSLKAKDIPDSLAEAKIQYMKVNKQLKENKR
jgi:hypothetical protein|tara:strand:+ start:1069 stop:1416 length:348 start_codon:yes stop_codon:yes gene_type:complete